MANHLSDVLGGGTDRVLLPGWVLSGGTLGHQFELRDHLVSVARRDATNIEAVEAIIESGAFEYGMPAYNDVFLDDDMLPVLLAINLRQHHPNVGTDDVSALINDNNRDAIRRHLLRAWDYRVRRPQARGSDDSPSPPNWRKTIGFLRRVRKLSPDQIRNLGNGELANEVLANPDEPTAEEMELAKAKRAEKEHQKNLRSFGRLDTIAADHGLTPLQLCDIEVQVVHGWVLERRNVNLPPPAIRTTEQVFAKYRKHHGVGESIVG